MENEQLTEIDLRNTLCEVRKAHRLIQSFQQRMMDLAKFIATKLDMPLVYYVKWFSDGDIEKYDYGKIVSAWDFLGTYQGEHYFGEKKTGNYEYAICMLQCVDTGFFDAEDNDKEDVTSFKGVNDASSKFIFYVHRIQKGSKWTQWDNRGELYASKEYMKNEFTSKVINFKGKETILLYAFPMERFLDEQSTLKALQEFVDYTNRELKLDIEIH